MNPAEPREVAKGLAMKEAYGGFLPSIQAAISVQHPFGVQLSIRRVDRLVTGS
jgi:hypothetical protein